jgi:hypothetical protein
LLQDSAVKPERKLNVRSWDAVIVLHQSLLPAEIPTNPSAGNRDPVTASTAIREMSAGTSRDDAERRIMSILEKQELQVTSQVTPAK